MFDEASSDQERPPGDQGPRAHQYPRPSAGLGSKLSVGLSNSVSHSSYNSANEVSAMQPTLINKTASTLPFSF